MQRGRAWVVSSLCRFLSLLIFPSMGCIAESVRSSWKPIPQGFFERMKNYFRMEEKKGKEKKKKRKRKRKEKRTGWERGKSGKANTRKKREDIPIHTGSKKGKCFGNIIIVLGTCPDVRNAML